MTELRGFYRMMDDIGRFNLKEVGDLADYVLNQTINHLENDIGQLYEYHYFILVPLKSLSISMDLKSVVYEGYRSSRNLVLNTFGIGETVPVNWVETYRNQKEVLENNLSLLNAKPLSTRFREER